MILLDTHAAFWVLAAPDRLSKTARDLVEKADDVSVAAISWYELAWLIDAQRITVDPDARTWLEDAARVLDTVPLTWTVAHRAADLSRHPSFPKDPADRIIYATAVLQGWMLVTQDLALRAFDQRVCLW